VGTEHKMRIEMPFLVQAYHGCQALIQYSILRCKKGIKKGKPVLFLCLNEKRTNAVVCDVPPS